MANTKGPSIKEQAIQVLFEKGPMNVEGLAEFIQGVESKSIHTKCLELKGEGYLTRDDATMIWSLVKGVTPDSYNQAEGRKQPGGGGGGQAPAQAPGADQTLDPKGQFEALVRSTGVDKAITPTIANQFFSGDIDKLEWLKEMLTRNAAGFVAPAQARMIITTWSKMRGLPYDPNQFPIEGESRGKGGKEGEKEVEVKPSAYDKLGIGWSIQRDKHGDWVPVASQGGSLTHAQALDAAERRSTIDQLNPARQSEEDGEEGAGDGKGGGKAGSKKPVSIQDYMLQKLIDKMFGDEGGGFGGNNPAILALQTQNQQLAQSLQEMKEAREQEKMDKLQEQIAILASRNPWDDPTAIAVLKQRLGVTGGGVTDASPAVQLIKDSTDKMDKNVERLTGLFERVILKGDVFTPEEKRSPAEKEQKAGQLLTQVSTNQKSVDLRRRTFGQ